MSRYVQAQPLTVLLLLFASVGVLSGCASSSGGLSGDPADYGAPTAEAAVREFLDAARQQDYRGMAQQFGDTDGPAEEQLGVVEVEQRMMVLAGLLGHDSYQLERRDLAQVGPDRARYVATMRGTRRGTVDVPVIAAEASEGRWFVEQVVMDRLTGGR